MKILITGGAGMIGSNLASKLLLEGHELVIIDNLWRGSIDNLKHTCGENFRKIKLIIADLSTHGDWFKYFNDIDCVYHLADIVAGIGYVFSNEGYLFRKNLQINTNVAQVVSSFKNIKRYIYVGTACSFPKELQNGIDAAPLKEIDQFPASPESAYGWSKLMGELDAKYLHEESGINTVILSLHNVYGTPCDYNSNRSQVIPSLIYRAISSKSGKLDVWGNGKQGRAFIHVNDIVNGLFLALTRGENQGVIQLGPNVCTTIEEVANTIVEISDKKLTVEFDTTKPTGDLGRCANYEKAKNLMNWEPSVCLKDGLKEIYNYIKNKE
ncbi:MAG: NAD-dependent epimerase/dehydratase family protein [Chitinophagaceae bacterium]|nr:NAD-dependent epimerase/dehydratase family protein [Chitinophagaceae bacterium]